MNFKIYIIGKIPPRIDESCVNKFHKVHSLLYNQGFTVINPLVRLTKMNFTSEEAKIRNFQDLMYCDAVYLLPCVSISQYNINEDLKVALDRNVLIFNGEVDVISD